MDSQKHTRETENSLLQELQGVQAATGCTCGGSLAQLASAYDLSRSEVYGVATFYSFLSRKPLGRNVIRVCKSLPCYLKNSRPIIESITRELGIKPGETTLDGRFSLELTNCIGACDGSPAMLVNSDVHVNLTPEKIVQVLKSYA